MGALEQGQLRLPRASVARVHSRYGRTLTNVPAGGRSVLVGLSVRPLFCDSQGCGQRTFAEQVEGLTMRCQRRSPLLQQLLERPVCCSPTVVAPGCCRS